MFELLMGINWRQPLWFLLALQPLLLWLAIAWLKNHSQQNFVDKHLLPWVKVTKNQSIWQQVFSRNTSYILACLCFALALADPQVVDNRTADSASATQDVVLLIDLSRSMYATDIAPSRLRRAVLEAYEFLSLIKSARVGVVVYAARPHLLVPPTSDLEALKFYLKELDSLRLPTQGSAHASAILFAQNILMRQGDGAKNIVWLTDADLQDASLSAINKALAHATIKTHALGIANTEGVAIPASNGAWLEANGQGVIARAELEKLSKNVRNRGGVFSKVSDNESDWQNIIQKGILRQAQSQKGVNNAERWRELYGWFLFPALAFLFLAYFPSLKGFFTLLLVSGVIAFSTASAEENYLEKIYQGAESYQTDDPYSAKSAFVQAVLSAQTDKERAIALHNLGNAVFQIGDYANATILFTDALRYDATQQASQNNQSLSYELYQILEKRRQKRQARGNGSNLQNPILLDLPDVMPPSMNTKAQNMTKFTLPKMPKERLDRLLKKGLAHLQLVESESAKGKEALKEKQNINDARLYLMGLEEQQASSNPLWERLFEIEEGFAGKLKEPKTLPGVRPW